MYPTRRVRFLTSAALSIMILYPRYAQADIGIGFENDPVGLVPSGFASADSPLVHFYDSEWVSGDGGLVIQDYVHQSHLKALGAFGGAVLSDFSSLVMEFDVLVGALHFEFGNDDPNPGSGPGATTADVARLTLYEGAVQVGEVTQLLNANDAMDQAIVFAGVPFDRAVFTYTQPNGQPLFLGEIVDNISFTPAVPEPSSLGMGCGVLALISWQMRKRRLGTTPRRVARPRRS